MDRYALAWFQHLDAKLDLILQHLGAPDPARLAALRGHVDAQAARLKAAVAAAEQPPSPPTRGDLTMAKSVDDLVAAVAAEDTVINSAIALITGFAKRLQDAIAAALAGGATAAELAPLTALAADVTAKTQALGDAVVANTPPVIPPVPPIVPPVVTP